MDFCDEWIESNFVIIVAMSMVWYDSIAGACVVWERQREREKRKKRQKGAGAKVKKICWLRLQKLFGACVVFAVVTVDTRDVRCPQELDDICYFWHFCV
jgi:hypothetical protein